MDAVICGFVHARCGTRAPVKERGSGGQTDTCCGRTVPVFVSTNMSAAQRDPPAGNLDIDPDFEPQKRPRSCTWPLPRPESGPGKSGTGDADVIPEEEDDEGEAREPGASQPAEAQRGPGGQEAADGSPCSARTPPAAPQQLRKSSARRNAWGSYSYADLITQAIDGSADKRLTLAQIYDWMVRSVPYFKDKGDSNSSAGWKVRAGSGSVRTETSGLFTG